MRGNMLEEIIAYKRAEVEKAHCLLPQRELEDKVRNLGPTKDFKAALKQDCVALIAEVKFKSPSKGIINKNVTLAEAVASYREAAAEAISVVTDQRYFGGSGRNLREARKLTEQPLLRKDFIVDVYQIYESRLLGADAVLLLSRVLSGETLKEYIATAEELGLAALVECRNREEIDRALSAGATVIGINNRDLSTFEVNLDTTFRLVEDLRDDHLVVVSESGISRRRQVELLASCGLDAVLVGEALMSASTIGEKALSLRGVPCRREKP